MTNLEKNFHTSNSLLASYGGMLDKKKLCASLSLQHCSFFFKTLLGMWIDICLMMYLTFCYKPTGISNLIIIIIV